MITIFRVYDRHSVCNQNGVSVGALGTPSGESSGEPSGDRLNKPTVPTKNTQQSLQVASNLELQGTFPSLDWILFISKFASEQQNMWFRTSERRSFRPPSLIWSHSDGQSNNFRLYGNCREHSLEFGQILVDFLFQFRLQSTPHSFSTGTEFTPPLERLRKVELESHSANPMIESFH